jgi:catechol 2,3-dioxygenase-like lactoylglutathione lyase family enzyme
MPNAFSASEANAGAAALVGATGVHHVGMSVADLDAALSFWESFLGVAARWRTVLDRPYLGRHVGYPGIAIRAAFVDLPGGNTLELLDYQTPGKVQNAEATANPGNVHLCLAVSDADGVWRHAVACGARAIVPEGPVSIDGGPNKGAKAAYLRIHDGITLELFQPVHKEQAE